MLIGIMRELKYANAETFKAHCHLEIWGFQVGFTYAFDGKYFSEFNFGYNGSKGLLKMKGLVFSFIWSWMVYFKRKLYETIIRCII